MARTSTSFKPGQSGNPGGQFKDAARFEFKQAMESLLPKAVERLNEMLDATLANGQPDIPVRQWAVNTAFDRTVGKSVERKEISGTDGGAIKIEDSTPAIRLLLQQAMDEPKVIEGKAE